MEHQKGKKERSECDGKYYVLVYLFTSDSDVITPDVSVFT